MTEILALDLSLTSTGWAKNNGCINAAPLTSPVFESGLIKTRLLGAARLAAIRDQVLALAAGAEIVLLEGYSYGSQTQREVLGELGGVIRVALWEASLEVQVVPPKCVKIFATNSGNASKSEVLAAAVRRLNYCGYDNNEADALWLLAMGRRWAFPLAASPVPKAHDRAFANLAWAKSLHPA